MTNVLALPIGTELVGDFRIERMLGAGGFGVTYLATEIALARQVTIKEYFPSDLAARRDDLAAVPRDPDSAADFQWGLDRFIEEAQALARFDHPNIVKVYRYFRANESAYMVLQFEQGQSLKAWLKGLGRHPRQRELDRIVEPLLEALEVVHAGDFLHRDIAPDNIIIRPDGTPVLIDFGSARGEIAARSRTVSALVKPGYSPYEQYAENGVRQGPWTDIYALGATLYFVITGKRPPDSPSRVVKDDFIPAREAALAAYRPSFLAAIDRALAIDTDSRPQSVAAWRGDLLAPEPPKPSWFQRKSQRAESDIPAKTRPLDPNGAIPPPPDVPAPKGALLDYMDGLRRDGQREGAPQPAAAAAQANAPTVKITAPPMAPEPPEQARPASGPASNGGKRAAKATKPKSAPAPEPLPVPVKPKPPKPKPVGWSAGKRWRSFAVKFLIGAGVAGAAVAMQDKMPRVDVGASVGLITGSLSGANRLPLPILAGHRGGTNALAFADDGRQVVTAGADGTLKVWNATSGALVRTLALDEGPATALSLIGTRVIAGRADGGIEMWDYETAQRLARYKRNEANIWSLAFTGTPGRFVASSHDWTASIWDAAAPPNEPVAVLEGHSNAVQAVAYSQAGGYIATGSADKTVKLWRAGDLSLVRTYRGHREYVTAVAFSPDGRYLASAGLDGVIRVWQTSSNSLARVMTGHKGRVAALAFAPSGDVIATAGEDGSVRLWPYKQSSRSARVLSEQGVAVRAIGFAPDGRRLAIGSADGTTRLVEASLPQKQQRQ